MPRPARAHRDRSPDGRMTLGEHLAELRYRVVVSLIAVVITTIVAYVFHGHILSFISQPYCDLPAKYRALPGSCKLVAFGVLEPFTVTLKLSLYAGVLAACPIWLFQLWRFITPGLYSHERRYASAFVSISVLLFAMGAAFAYLTLPKSLHFLLGVANGDISSLLPFNNYLSFFMGMVLVFAASFELPLLVVMLNLIGILPAERLRGWSRAVIFGIFVFAAVATPSQDPFTMLALSVPMCLLYGVAVLIATLHDRRVARRAPLYGDLADDELSSIDDEQTV
ncbi:MAG TPA: twin-arginine translocase subunit TatC [Mycobacteriales bacterium]|jgi:sec-independent protein translocase protein TatC|nr:twin-arginine translocase subunit TatC [Mycobacteriales bacterium]